MTAAKDHIILPVTDTAFAAHSGWALIDADLLLHYASALLAAGVTLLAPFLAALVTDQIAPAGFILVGVLVNSLSTDAQQAFFFEPSSNLFGRQLKA